MSNNKRPHRLMDEGTTEPDVLLPKIFDGKYYAQEQWDGKS